MNGNFKRKYGMTIEDYKTLLESQEYRCAICNEHMKNLRIALCVDHHHATKKIRGLLCDCCNRGIGFLKDNSEICNKAAIYLNNRG